MHLLYVKKRAKIKLQMTEKPHLKDFGGVWILMHLLINSVRNLYYHTPKNQGKFLGLDKNHPKVYAIHREVIFVQNAKHKFHKSHCDLYLILSIPKNKMCLQIHVDTLFLFALHVPGNFNDF